MDSELPKMSRVGSQVKHDDNAMTWYDHGNSWQPLGHGGSLLLFNAEYVKGTHQKVLERR